MTNTKNIIITLFSDETVRLDSDSISRIREGFYPARVKSKILAAIRDVCADSDNSNHNLVGFLPVTKVSQDFKNCTFFPEDYNQDHYSNLALYLSPEIPCNIVADLLKRGRDGSLNCREDLVIGSNVIVISDDCADWTELEYCLKKAGANSIKCITIFNN